MHICKMKLIAPTILALFIVIFSHCQTTTEIPHHPPVVVKPGDPGPGDNGGNYPGGDSSNTNEEEQIFIVDRKGKEWDITHAVNVYGFLPQNFQFGVGIGAIPPILTPEFCQSGDPDFPSPDQTFLVLGFAVNGECRAYPLSIMRRFEVANDIFGSSFVTVAY